MSTGEVIIALINAGVLGYVIFYLQKMHGKQIDALKEQNQALKEKNSMLEVLSTTRLYDDLKAKTEYYEGKIREIEEKGLAKEEELNVKLENVTKEKTELVEFAKSKYGVDLSEKESVVKYASKVEGLALVSQMKLGQLMAEYMRSQALGLLKAAVGLPEAKDEQDNAQDDKQPGETKEGDELQPNK